ncbi:uncharacterized protein TNCV_4091131 [Trichonephila clavipes]|nr:uncharacterized protein TNCV_4091131 [Trichonephila clavipes]
MYIACVAGGTLNSRRAASPLVKLVEGEERWEASDPQSVLSLNWGGIEPNHTVTCMVLKAAANDRRHLALCHDEFRGPGSGLCRTGGISNNNNSSTGSKWFLVPWFLYRGPALSIPPINFQDHLILASSFQTNVYSPRRTNSQ